MTRITPAASIVAHQGGWDEILLVGGPIVIIFVLLRIAKRRVDAQAAATDAQAHESPTDGPATT